MNSFTGLRAAPGTFNLLSFLCLLRLLSSPEHYSPPPRLWGCHPRFYVSAAFLWSYCLHAGLETASSSRSGRPLSQRAGVWSPDTF